jgi:hypothetical protein
MDAGDDGAQAAACQACELQCATNNGVLLYYTPCFEAKVQANCATSGSPTVNASDGPKKGTPKTQLCQAVLACLRTTQCALDINADPAATCWCSNSGARAATCLNPGVTPTGPCRTVIENGFESTASGTIAPRFNSPCFASAAAVNLYQFCDALECAGPCLGMSMGTGGAGGSGGAGGNGGSGGGSGGSGGSASGGAGGSGGSLGSGGSTGTGGSLGTGGASGAGGLTGAGGIGGSGGGGGSGGSGGSTGGQGGAAGSGVGGSGGIAGSGGAGGSHLPSVCSGVDLDGNGVLDCHETLVTNDGFDFDWAGWMAEYGITLSHAPNDAASSTQPGSLAVNFSAVPGTNGVFVSGASQCVPLAASGTYGLWAEASIAAGQGAAGASVSIWFYGSADCSGTIAKAVQSPLTTATGSWQVLTTATQSPAGAGSAAVRLVVQKPGTLGPFVVQFDNVLFKRQ